MKLQYSCYVWSRCRLLTEKIEITKNSIWRYPHFGPRWNEIRNIYYNFSKIDSCDMNHVICSMMHGSVQDTIFWPISRSDLKSIGSWKNYFLPASTTEEVVISTFFKMNLLRIIFLFTFTDSFGMVKPKEMSGYREVMSSPHGKTYHKT